ncbi:MAG TPA: cupin domain-containing protein [Edaphobacter sp.]
MPPATTAINLEAKLATFSEHWSPKIVATYNGNDVMVVKIKGEFIWHSHTDTDDFFLVLCGSLRIDLRDTTGAETHVDLAPGELYIVPRGVEHRPVAIDEVHLLLIEPTGTPNTGDPSTAVRKEVI